MDSIIKHKLMHISNQSSGNWSFGIGLTHDSGFNETYIFINFFKWHIYIGKTAYLKPLDNEEEEC